jgi:xylulokinase
VRALLESVAFMLRENVELLRELGIEVRELVSMGGGARSDLWLQIKADVTGLPLRVPPCEETASLGAAMLAAVAAGLYPDVETAYRQMAGESRHVSPNAAHRAAYDAAYDRYTSLYERLEPLFGGQ